MKFYLLIFFSACTISASAQIRHVKGIKSADVNYLLTRFGSGANVSYVRYFSNSVYGKAGAFLEQGTDAGLSYQSIGVDITAAKTALHLGHNVYLNGIMGCSISIDNIKNGGEQFSISSQFKIGAFAGIETEVFINDRFVLVLPWSQKFLAQNPFGNFRWFFSPGIRYNF